MAKCEIQVFIYFEKKDHTKNMCFSLFSDVKRWGEREEYGNG